MHATKRILLRWVPVLAWAGVIYTLSAQPDLRSPLPDVWDLILRKIAHVTEYAVLGWLLARAIDPDEKTSRGLWGAAVLGILYAASDEIHQGFVPGRHPAVLDVLIDAAGVAIGISVARLRVRRSRGGRRAGSDRGGPDGGPT